MKIQKKFFLGFILITSTLLYSQSQVGINTSIPSQTLDIDGSVRVRDMTNVNTEALALEYNHKIVANGDGNLGYVTNRSTEVPWTFSDNRYAVLVAPIPGKIANGRVNLNFNVLVIVPARSQAQVVINYSMPVTHTTSVPSTINFIGCKLYKAINGGIDTELEMGSRKISVVGFYNGNGTANGRSISGFAIDIVSNTGNVPISVLYKVDGNVEGNDPVRSTIWFGMWLAAPSPNFNWGRGAMFAQIFTKPFP